MNHRLKHLVNQTKPRFVAVFSMRKNMSGVLGFALSAALMLAALSISTLVSAQELVCDIGPQGSTAAPSASPKKFQSSRQASAHNKRSGSLKRSRIATQARQLLYPATIAKLQGRVFLMARSGVVMSEPVALYEGSELRSGDVLQTHAQSFVSFRLGDGSTTMLPSNSRVELAQASRTVARYILQSGEVQNRVPKKPRARANTFEIQTPGSMIGVRGTDFSVRLSPTQAFAQVNEGTVWVRSRLICAAPLVLNAGFGAVLTDRPVAVSMLAAPQLINPDHAQPNADLSFKAQAVDGAVRYRAQVVGDMNDLETLAETYSEQPDLIFDHNELPNGYYYVKLTAFDAAGVQGKSKTYLFLRNARVMR